MKKITLNINGIYARQKNAEEIQKALTSLSGVVVAEVLASDSKVYAYAGDELDALLWRKPQAGPVSRYP